MEHTYEDLRTLQALPLERKILISQVRISEWYMRYGRGGVTSLSLAGKIVQYC